MASRTLRAAIVGASTLLGRELAEQLSQSTGLVWDISLFDAEDAAGQVTEAGDEPLVIQALLPGSFDRMDVVFFASDAATTRTHWKEAQASGAGVVDLTGALAGEAGARVLAPGVGAVGGIDLATTLVIPAHAAAMMLALVATRLKQRFAAGKLVATVMEPASEQGKAGLDELHQQTVGLLSFQAVPKDVYDMQVAFNLTPGFGSDAKASLVATAKKINGDFAAIASGCDLALQVLQVPVFNGYTASVFVELADVVTEQEVREALHGGLLDALTVEDPGPSNMTALGQKLVLIAARKDAALAGGFWLWMAADNLLFATQNAVACAMELAKLRPAGKVQ
jgi:aspartate-semialdehyde dehydrogenase